MPALLPAPHAHLHSGHPQANILVCQPGDIGHVLRTIGMRRRHPQHTIHVGSWDYVINRSAKANDENDTMREGTESCKSPWFLCQLLAISVTLRFASSCTCGKARSKCWPDIYFSCGSHKIGNFLSGRELTFSSKSSGICPSRYSSLPSAGARGTKSIERLLNTFLCITQEGLFLQ